MGEPAVEGRDLEVSADEQPGLEKTTAEGQAVLVVGVQGHAVPISMHFDWGASEFPMYLPF